MTMRELARLANVSVSTVSKAFGDADDVCPETKERIFRIAKEYGCFGKYYKGKFSKKVYAIVCPELISDFYIGFVERLKNVIEENGGIVTVSADNFNDKKQAELIEYFASYLHVDGIVVFGLKSKLKKGYDIPIVSIFSSKDPSVDSVQTDFDVAMHKAVELLAANGHQRVAFIGEKKTSAKADCFCNACRCFPSLSPSVYESTCRFEKAGQEAVEHLFAQDQSPTALVCAYDYIAIGAMKALKERGIPVPDRVSVIGADNIASAEYTEVPLTTIDSMPDEICDAVWDLLLKKQHNKYYHAHRDIIFKATLVIRDSVTNVCK